MKGQRSDGSKVIARYTQQVLSGWGNSDKQADKNSQSIPEGESITWNATPSFWQQEAYTILVPVIVKRVAIRGNEYEYEIRIPTNVDVLVSPNLPTSQRLLKQVSSLAKTAKRDNTKVSLVSRISEEGKSPLSPASSDAIPATIAYVYSRILGIVNRAVECMVLQPGQAQGDADNGYGNQLSQGQEGSLGEHQEGGRSKAIRSKVRPKDDPKDASRMVEVDG